MRDQSKKKWTTPKLRVFTRSKADERVLGQCKQRGHVGPHVYPDYCHTPPACSGIGQS
jgi:hypothetical protein